MLAFVLRCFSNALYRLCSPPHQSGGGRGVIEAALRSLNFTQISGELVYKTCLLNLLRRNRLKKVNRTSALIHIPILTTEQRDAFTLKTLFYRQQNRRHYRRQNLPKNDRFALFTARCIRSSYGRHQPWRRRGGGLDPNPPSPHRAMGELVYCPRRQHPHYRQNV